MDDHSSHPGSPHATAGPYQTEREAAAAVRHITASPAEAWGPGLHKVLEDACTAAGVELGAYDHAILLWLAGWEPSTVAVVAGLIARAHEKTGLSGVAQPGGGWISGPSI